MKKSHLIIFFISFVFVANAQKKTFARALEYAGLTTEETTAVLGIDAEKLSKIKAIRAEGLDKNIRKQKIKEVKQEAAKNIKKIVGQDKQKKIATYWSGKKVKKKTNLVKKENRKQKVKKKKTFTEVLKSLDLSKRQTKKLIKLRNRQSKQVGALNRLGLSKKALARETKKVNDKAQEDAKKTAGEEKYKSIKEYFSPVKNNLKKAKNKKLRTAKIKNIQKKIKLKELKRIF